MALITKNSNSQKIIKDLLQDIVKSSQQIKAKTEQQANNSSNAQLNALLDAINNVNNSFNQTLTFQIDNIEDIKLYKDDVIDSAKDFVDNYNNVIQQFVIAKENYEQQLTEAEKEKLQSYLAEMTSFVEDLSLIRSQEQAIADLVTENTSKLKTVNISLPSQSLGDIITDKINQFNFYDNNPFGEIKKINSLANTISERAKEIKKIAPAVNNDELVNNIMQTFDMIKLNVSKNKENNKTLTETEQEARKISLYKNIQKLEQQSGELIDDLTDNVEKWESLGTNSTDVFKAVNDVMIKHLKVLEMSVIDFPKDMNWKTKAFDEVKIHDKITKLNDRYIEFMQDQSEKFFAKLNAKDLEMMTLADNVSNQKRYVRLTNKERAINVFDMESPNEHNYFVFNDKFKENFENMRRVLDLNNNSRKNALKQQQSHNKKTKLNSDITAQSDAYAIKQTQFNEAVLQTSKSAYKPKLIPLSKLGSNNVAMAKQMVNTLSQSIYNTTLELNIQKTIDPNSAIVKALEKQRKELEKEKEDWEKSLNGDNFKFFKTLFSNLTSAPAFLDKALGMLGVGGLFSVKKFADLVISRYKENGKLLYQDAMTNASIGVEQTSGSYHRVFDLGNKYWKMSGGRIMPETFVANYSDLAKNVGGAYGASKGQVASDLDYLNHQFTVRQAVLGIDTSDVGVWYKANKKSAEETIGIIDRLTTDAQTLNVPVKTYIKTVSGLGEQMRNLGTDATFAMPMIKGFIQQGMRIEDAKHVIGQVLGVQSHERDNMSSAYYGMLNGEGSSIYDVYVQGQLTHDSNGDVIGNQYQKMGSRLLTKLNMFSSSFGQGTAPGMMATLQVLKQEGFDNQTISQLAPMVANGDIEGMAKILEGKDSEEDEYNKNQALENKLNDYEKALQTATNQLSVKEQLEQARLQSANKVATLLETKLKNEMNGIAEIFSNVTSSIDTKLRELVQKLGEISKMPWAQTLMKLWITNPLQVLGGGVLAYVTGKSLLKYGGRYLLNKAKNAKFNFGTKNAPLPKTTEERRRIFEEHQTQQASEHANQVKENRASMFGNHERANAPSTNHTNSPRQSNSKLSNRSKIGATLALGTGILTYAGISHAGKNEDTPSKEEIQARVDSASKKSFLDMFVTGTAKMRLVDENGQLVSKFSILNTLKENSVLALVTSTVAVTSAFAMRKKIFSNIKKAGSYIKDGASLTKDFIKNNKKTIAVSSGIGVVTASGMSIAFDTESEEVSSNNIPKQSSTTKKSSNISNIPMNNNTTIPNDTDDIDNTEDIENPHEEQKPFEYYNKEDGIEKFGGTIKIPQPPTNPMPNLPNNIKNNYPFETKQLQSNGIAITNDMLHNGIDVEKAKTMFPNYDIKQVFGENTNGMIDEKQMQTIKCIMNLSGAPKNDAKLFKEINADDKISGEELQKMFDSNDKAYKGLKDYMKQNGFDYENMTDIEKDIFKEMMSVYGTGEATLATLLKLLITAKQDYDSKVKQINNGKGFNGGNKIIDKKGQIQQLKDEVKDQLKKEWDKELEEGKTNLIYADLALKKYNEAKSQEEKNKYSGLNTYLKVVAGDQNGLNSLLDELHADLNNKKFNGKKVYGATKVSFDTYDKLAQYAKQIGGEDTLLEIMDTWKKRWDDEKDNLYAYGYELKLLEATKNKENFKTVGAVDNGEYVPINAIGAYDPGFGPGELFKNVAYAVAQRTNIPLELLVALAWSEQGGSQSTWDYGTKHKNWFGITPQGNDKSVIDSAGTNRTASYDNLERAVKQVAETLDDDGYRTTNVDTFMQTLVKNGYVASMQVGDETYITKRNSFLAGLKVAKAWGMTSNTVNSFVANLGGVGQQNSGATPNFFKQQAPLTIQETRESMENRYLNSVGGIHGKLGRTLQGAIVGGNRIDTSQRFKSANEIRNEYLFGRLKKTTPIPEDKKTITNAPSIDKTAHTIEKLTQQQMLFKKFEEHKNKIKNEIDSKYVDTAIMNITGQMKKGKKYKDMMKEINEQIASLNCSVEQEEKLSGGLTL